MLKVFTQKAAGLLNCVWPFYEHQAFTGSTNENTFYIHNTDWNIVISKLEDCTIKLFKWFEEKHLKANADKCHLLVITDKPISINIEDNIISNNEKENHLTITSQIFLKRQVKSYIHLLELLAKCTEINRSESIYYVSA